MGPCKAFMFVAFVASSARAFQTVRMNSSRVSVPVLHAIATPPSEERDKKKKKSSRGKDIVAHVESITDYKRLVVEEKSSITVVRFYSRYCKSCQASEPLFYKLAADFHDHGSHGVHFVEVPLNAKTKVLHEALEVPSLPWTHIYHPDAGLVEERKVSKKHIEDVRKSLRCYVYGECDLADAPANCINIYGECDIDDGPDGVWM